MRMNTREPAQQNIEDLSRSLLYDGRIHRFQSSTLHTVAAICNSWIAEHPLDLDIFDSASNKIYLQHLNTLRHLVSGSHEIYDTLLEALSTLGWPLDSVFTDRVRFRCIPASFQNHPQARALLCWHRDTYYANAACQLNLWIPLSQCNRKNGIVFFPDLLDTPLQNDSHRFDLQEWNSQGGFQAYRESSNGEVSGTGLTYPSATDPPDPRSGFIPDIGPGEGLIFASRHLHGTMPNTSGQNRYSLELRFCTRRDLEAADEKLNVDNGSRGCFASEFKNAATGEVCPEDLWKRYEQKTRSGS